MFAGHSLGENKLGSQKGAVARDKLELRIVVVSRFELAFFSAEI